MDDYEPKENLGKEKMVFIRWWKSDTVLIFCLFYCSSFFYWEYL